MLDVVIALIPALLVAVAFFGWNAVRLLFLCCSTCMITEAVCRRMMGRDLAISDYSALLTGLLLAFNLPPTLPSWMAIVGSVFAIAVAKQVFGGIGYNPFNPALVGRAMLLVSFPAAMTRWHPALHPGRWSAWSMTDATTMATPLGAVKTAMSSGSPLPFTFDSTMTLDFLIGRMGGCIGEVSAIALLLGGAYLIWRKVITWHTPVSFIGSAAIFWTILWAINGEANMPPHFHILAGGLMLGAIFMATDMVTTPVTQKGMVVFGVGCGILTVLIRKWGGYPEGVSFAILIMNAFTPLINRATKPAMFGRRDKDK